MPRLVNFSTSAILVVLAGHSGSLLAANADLEEIVITGTRLQSAGAQTSNPTTSVSADAIQLSGATNITDLLVHQPALVGSSDTTQTTGTAGFIGSTGLNLLDLRNLGTDRTLVLVDGRRHVAQLPETASVDTNTIPIDLVERIDIVTGGVSAIYGADAVSGVVNFVMKKNFQGVAARAQIGRAEGGKPTNWLAALTAGSDFADGRGNISGAFEYTNEGRLRAADRSYLRGLGYYTMHRNPLTGAGQPKNVPLNDMRFFDSSREGGVDVDFDGVPDLRPDGSSYIISKFIPPFYTQGGTGTLQADYIGDVVAENRHSVLTGLLHYDFSDRTRLFGEAKFAHGKAFSDSQPTFDYYLYLTAQNPFLAPAVQSQIIPGIGASLTGDPATPDGVLVNRDNFDLGVRGEAITRDTTRAVIGLNGELGDQLNYEVSYNYGESKVRAIDLNNRYNDRFLAALDVVINPANGQPVCRSNLDPAALPFQPFQSFDFSAFGPGQLSFTPGANSGCLPLNILGEGVASPAAVAWVMTNSVSTSKITQNVFNGFLTGKVPGFELPGGAVEYVLGGEWRKETSESHPPLEDQAGLTFGNKLFPTKGSFDVKEAFSEIRVPVFKQLRFAEELQLNGALRLSSYSTVGSTTTWNLGATWAPIKDVALRATLAQSVRAPNISELFSPQSQDFLFIDDPCDISRLANGSQYRAANCATILNALGVDPATYTDPNSSNISGLLAGNASLAQETARSWTTGVVLRPRFAPNLALAVDAYDVKINNAINTPDAQTLADNCVDQPTINNVFCAALTRSATTGGIKSFIVKPQNVANFHTSGVDFTLNYAFVPSQHGASAAWGKFAFAVIGNHLNSLTFIKSPGADVEDDRTTKYAPEWQTNLDLTWTRDRLTVAYGLNYFSKTTRYSLATIAGTPDIAAPRYLYYQARQTHDLQLAFDMQKNLRIYAGVNNLTDQKPDISPNYPVSPVGRFVYVGVKAKVGMR
jgi:outer membrane receptor protein involved in Fe transport